MTVAVSAGKPFTLTKAYVELDGVDLTCLTNHLVMKPDVTKETAKSICGSVDYVGTVKWIFGLTLYQSFEDETATYQVLQGAVDAGVACPYIVRPTKAAASMSNPEWSGLVNPEPFTIFDSEAGRARHGAVRVDDDRAAGPRLRHAARDDRRGTGSKRELNTQHPGLRSPGHRPDPDNQPGGRAT